MSPDYVTAWGQVAQNVVYCAALHFMLWQQCEAYRAWLRGILARLRPVRTKLYGQLAADANETLKTAGL
jgi:hypothetical protein